MGSNIRIVLVVLLLLLAGCAGAGNNVADSGDGASPNVAQSGGGDGGGSMNLDSAADADGQQRADGSGSEQSDAINQVRQQRAIIRSGQVVVEVENFSNSRKAIATRARSLGGYVSDSNQRLHRDGNATWRTGYVVVRIPSEEYEAMQEMSGSEGTVISESTETKDVTDQLVDLEARIENLESRRDRLRTFYSRANDTEELLRIEEQLSEVQGEIERLKAKQRSLEERVAFSTLRVELREPHPDANEIRTQYHEQSLVTVFLTSVADVIVFGQATLVTIAGALPWLAVLAIPVIAVVRVIRGRSRPSFPSLRGKEETESQERDESVIQPGEAQASDDDAVEGEGTADEDESTDESR